MMGFKEFLAESDHSAGTYVNAKLSDEDKTRLHDWVVANGVNHPVDKEQYHATIIYSKKPCLGAVGYDYKAPYSARITGWKIFDSKLGRCLVAAIQSDQLDYVNHDLMVNHGAISDFPSYQPHVTIAWHYEGDAPSTYPEFELTFDRVEVKALDPNWKPK